MNQKINYEDVVNERGIFLLLMNTEKLVWI